MFNKFINFNKNTSKNFSKNTIIPVGYYPKLVEKYKRLYKDSPNYCYFGHDLRFLHMVEKGCRCKELGESNCLNLWNCNKILTIEEKWKFYLPEKELLRRNDQILCDLINFGIIQPKHKLK